MKKVILFLFLLLIPISVYAIEPGKEKGSVLCIFNDCDLKKDISGYYYCGDYPASINSDTIKKMLEAGYCPVKEAIVIRYTPVPGTSNRNYTIQNNQSYTKECKYGSDVLKYNGKSFTLNGDTATIENDIKFKMLSGVCPDEFYTQKENGLNNTITTVYSNEPNNTEESNNETENSSEENNAYSFTPPENNNKKMYFCEENGVKISLKLVGVFIFIAKILVPLLVIIFGFMDFYKAMVNSDEKNTKEALHTFIRRIITGIIVFFIPTLIDIALKFIDGYDGLTSSASQCQSCLFHPLDGCPTSSLGK